MKPEDYFDYTFCVKQGRPTFKVSFKTTLFSVNIPTFMSKSGKTMPLSPSCLEYFKHYIGSEPLAMEVYGFRRSLFNIENCIRYFKENGLVPEHHDQQINDWLYGNHREYDKAIKISEAGIAAREKYDAGRSKGAASCSVTLTERFADEEYKARRMVIIKDPKTIAKRMAKRKITVAAPEWKAKTKEAYTSSAFKAKVSANSKKQWVGLTEEEKVVKLRKMRCGRPHTLNGYNMNAPELIVGSTLNALGISWIYEPSIKCGFKTYFPDFLVPELNLIIECYGTYWHADPRVFSADSILFDGISASSLWSRDKDREDSLRGLGYDFCVLWETEIKNDQAAMVFILQDKLGVKNDNT